MVSFFLLFQALFQFSRISFMPVTLFSLSDGGRGNRIYPQDTVKNLDTWTAPSVHVHFNLQGGPQDAATRRDLP